MSYSWFLRVGFPIISILSYVICLVLVHSTARASPLFGNHQAKAGGLPVIICCMYLFIASCFMIFAGPAGIVKNSILYYIVAASGIYATLSGFYRAQVFFLAFTAFTFLCSIGVMPLFSFYDIVSHVSSVECNTFFGTVDATACKDNGYLMFIRVISAIGIYVIVLANLLSAIAFLNQYIEAPLANIIAPSGSTVAPESNWNNTTIVMSQHKTHSQQPPQAQQQSSPYSQSRNLAAEQDMQ